MRYYEDPCGYPARHYHGRPNIEIDVVPNWGGAFYPPPPPPGPAEVVYVTPAATYAPGTQVIMPQPYGGVTVASTAGYYPQQYQQQYQQYPQPYNPYSQW